MVLKKDAIPTVFKHCMVGATMSLLKKLRKAAEKLENARVHVYNMYTVYYIYIYMVLASNFGHSTIPNTWIVQNCDLQLPSEITSQYHIYVYMILAGNFRHLYIWYGCLKLAVFKVTGHGYDGVPSEGQQKTLSASVMTNMPYIR